VIIANELKFQKISTDSLEPNTKVREAVVRFLRGQQYSSSDSESSCTPPTAMEVDGTESSVEFVLPDLSVPPPPLPPTTPLSPLPHDQADDAQQSSGYTSPEQASSPDEGIAAAWESFLGRKAEVGSRRCSPFSFIAERHKEGVKEAEEERKKSKKHKSRAVKNRTRDGRANAEQKKECEPRHQQHHHKRSKKARVDELGRKKRRHHKSHKHSREQTSQIVPSPMGL